MKFLQVYSWKPKGITNFGDEIGPMIVRKLSKRYGLDVEVVPTEKQGAVKLLAVGSVLHEARGDDVIWGAGVNSKSRLAFGPNSNLHFNAVRGPLTRTIVMDQGISCPEIYGDPGLLFPALFDNEIRQRRGELEADCATLGMAMPETIFIPNINDDRFLPEYVGTNGFPQIMIVRPHWDPITVAAYISASSRVLASSLHGLVFADVYGRSTSRIISQYEPEFKYTDYYMGTGRCPPMAYPTIGTALEGEKVAPLDWDPTPLLEAFPLAFEEMYHRLIIEKTTITPDKPFIVSDTDPKKTPFLEGWSEPENGKVWAVGPWAHLRFILRDIDVGNMQLRLRVGTSMTGKGVYERVRVFRASKMISSYRINRSNQAQEIDIPIQGGDASGDILLSLELDQSSSSALSIDKSDSREAGIWISKISIVRKDI